MTWSNPFSCPITMSRRASPFTSAIVGDDPRYQPLVVSVHDAVVDTVAAPARCAAPRTVTGVTSATATRTRKRRVRKNRTFGRGCTNGYRQRGEVAEVGGNIT